MMSRCTLMVGACLIVCAAGVFAQDEQRKKRLAATLSFEKLDQNKDGYLDGAELPEPIKNRLERIDQNSDGKVSREEFNRLAARLGVPPAPAPSRPDTAAPAPDALFRLLDANNDGKLSKEELQNSPKLLDKLDRNKDGVLDQEELKAAPAKKTRPGEVNTPAAKSERVKDTLKVGDLAPDFTLPEPKGTRELTLSSYRGKKPVVLIFGSYT
jgi:Ca2+-binding EF-hand superfamily protein